MLILKWLWIIVGIGIAVQYGLWAIEIVGSNLGWCEHPAISDNWLFIGMCGAMFYSIYRVIEDISKMRHSAP